jgi:hypothetical protein
MPNFGNSARFLDALNTLFQESVAGRAKKYIHRNPLFVPVLARLSYGYCML